jgi:hypothetical protein
MTTGSHYLKLAAKREMEEIEAASPRDLETITTEDGKNYFIIKHKEEDVLPKTTPTLTREDGLPISQEKLGGEAEANKGIRERFNLSPPHTLPPLTESPDSLEKANKRLAKLKAATKRADANKGNKQKRMKAFEDFMRDSDKMVTMLFQKLAQVEGELGSVVNTQSKKIGALEASFARHDIGLASLEKNNIRELSLVVDTQAKRLNNLDEMMKCHEVIYDSQAVRVMELENQVSNVTRRQDMHSHSISDLLDAGLIARVKVLENQVEQINN